MNEKTKFGNEIVRDFSFAGCNGTELDLFRRLSQKGFRELYYNAPYYWGMINIKTKEIFTYTEGDTTLIKCKTLKSLKKEAEGYINFLKKSGFSENVYGEWEDIKKAIIRVSEK